MTREQKTRLKKAIEEAPILPAGGWITFVYDAKAALDRIDALEAEADKLAYALTTLKKSYKQTPTMEEKLVSRLRISEWTMEQAAKALERIAEIPQMQRDIELRMKQASSAAYNLRLAVKEQQVAYPSKKEA